MGSKNDDTALADEQVPLIQYHTYRLEQSLATVERSIEVFRASSMVFKIWRAPHLGNWRRVLELCHTSQLFPTPSLIHNRLHKPCVQDSRQQPVRSNAHIHKIALRDRRLCASPTTAREDFSKPNTTQSHHCNHHPYEPLAAPLLY